MQRSWFEETAYDDGTLRAPYAALRAHAACDPLQPTPEMVLRMRDRPLGDDAQILPVPLVLDDVEYRAVQRGVAQRALALQRLFIDLVLGSARGLAVDDGPTRCDVDAALAAEKTSLKQLRAAWSGHDPEEVRFVYAPDLLRVADGRWMVIEDNVGCVGGMADSHVVTELYRTAASMRCPPVPRERADLAAAVRRWLNRLGAVPGDIVVVTDFPGARGGAAGRRSDEDTRRRVLLRAVGAEIDIVDEWPASRGGGRQPVAIVNGVAGPMSRELFHRHRTPLLNAPGTGILGSKALLPFADAIVRHYTRQAPLLPTAPTRLSPAGRLPDGGKGWVVKTFAGCQGDEVVILDQCLADHAVAVESRLGREWARSAVIQRYLEPSRLTPRHGQGWCAHRIELRLLAYVLGGDDVHVGERPLGKVVSILDDRGLHNVSQGALYAPVLREPCSYPP